MYTFKCYNHTYSGEKQSLDFSKMQLTKHFMKVQYQTDFLKGAFGLKAYSFPCSQMSWGSGSEAMWLGWGKWPVRVAFLLGSKENLRVLYDWARISTSQIPFVLWVTWPPHGEFIPETGEWHVFFIASSIFCPPLGLIGGTEREWRSRHFPVCFLILHDDYWNQSTFHGSTDCLISPFLIACHIFKV